MEVGVGPNTCDLGMVLAKLSGDRAVQVIRQWWVSSTIDCLRTSFSDGMEGQGRADVGSSGRDRPSRLIRAERLDVGSLLQDM